MLRVDRVDSLQTEPIHIRAENLEEFTCFRIRLHFNHVSGSHVSHGIYYSDGFGVIDLERDAPIRGTYHDVDGMGLFASLAPTPSFRKGSMTRCSQGQPWIYTLQLFSPTDTLLDTVTLKKHWKHPLVSRIEIPEFHGFLYKPPGPGPFPCILDVHGANGGNPVERPAAMFASEGFMVLTFLYYSTRIKELPNDVKDVNVEDFQKPIDFLINHPDSNGKLGVYGTSFGGLLSNYLAVKYSQISAVISINFSEAFDDEMNVKENGKLLPSCGKLDDSLTIVKNEIHDQSKKYQKLCFEIKHDQKIPWKKIPKSTSFRLIGALDDWLIHSLTSIRHVQKDLKEAGLKVEIQLYSGGHGMDVPYFPHHQLNWTNVLKVYWGMGGECYLHGTSQMKVWKRNVQFFREHLGNGKTVEMKDWDREKVIVAALISRLGSL